MEEEKKKKRSVGKIILIILAVLFLLLLIAVTVVLIFVNGMLNKLDRQEITGDPNIPIEELYEGTTVDVEDSLEDIEQARQELEQVQQIDPMETANITNVLLVGSDRRSAYENGRSDSMMIVTMNHDTKKIHITSLMRAMYVAIPRSDGEVWDMLNASYSWGGTDLLLATIEKNFRVKIDHYIVVDLAAFDDVVDLMGGVDITLTQTEASIIQRVTNKSVSAGLQHLDGEQTWVYSRLRYIDNDFVRTSRQRRVIEQLMKKALTTDIPTLLEIANQVLPLVNTNLSNAQILYYLTQAPMLLAEPITQRMLPIENEAGTSYIGRIYVGGREMYRVNFEENIKALHEFMLS
ncbi:MAG: LCP family protein [Oscillospiraceae bacterium]|nr:LCP family protein [Oscillospiraceae bacterium]